MPGKADWLARGLSREGKHAGEPRAVDHARTDAVTCPPDERIGSVRDRVEALSYGFALVTSPHGVLLGRLHKAALHGDPNAVAEAVMEPGPSTVRADTPPAELRERLQRRDLTTTVITDPDGRLLGVVRTADLPTSADHPPRPARPEPSHRDRASYDPCSRRGVGPSSTRVSSPVASR
jgi:CBS-domain-containing membrane protein